MKKTIIVCCLMLLAGNIWSQQPKPVRPAITDESGEILKKMQKQWMELQSIKISFTLQSEKKGQKGSSIKGTLWSQGSSYKLQIPGQTIFCDGKNVWNYLPESQEVSINPYEDDSRDISINPLQVISEYDKHYRSAFIREEAEKGIAVQIIDLYPKKVQSFYKIRLVIRKDRQLPLRAVIYESQKDGSTDTYYFDQIIKNPKIGSGFFQFNAADYPGVEIIDMRE